MTGWETGVRRFGGRVIIVSGAARGIGFAIAHRLCAEGARVVGLDRERDAMEGAAGALRAEGGDCRGYALDLMDAAATERFVADLVEREGRLDGLVNNAGTTRYGTVAGTSADAFRETVGINLLPAYHLGRPAALRMAEAGRGRIVNISSAAGLRAVTGFAAYAVAKAALLMLTTQMAAEFGEHGITANAVAPGPVETEALRANQPEGSPIRAALRAPIPARRFAEPEEVAAVVAFFLSDDAAYVNGQVLGVDGGMAAVTAFLHRVETAA